MLFKAELGDIILAKKIRILREQYENLPARFVRKIDFDLRYLSEKNIPGLKGVYLFGSLARREARSTSDVDLLIVTEKKLEDREMAADIRWTLDEAIDGVRTDVVYRSEEHEAEKTVFGTVVNRDKILILEVEE